MHFGIRQVTESLAVQKCDASDLQKQPSKEAAPLKGAKNSNSGLDNELLNRYEAGRTTH